MKSINKRREMMDMSNYKYGYPTWDDSFPCLSHIITDKDARIETHLHYSDPTAHKERDVFGKAKKGLFYNYSDRLYGKEWSEGWEKALREAQPNTARFFEIVLKHFHDSEDLDLQHIILGCNMSNGYDYLVFGYTYTSKSKR